MDRNSFHTYGKVLTLFSTARYPEEGKPLGNNNRLWEVKDPNFGIGYKLEHYRTPIATRFPETSSCAARAERSRAWVMRSKNSVRFGSPVSESCNA